MGRIKGIKNKNKEILLLPSFETNTGKKIVKANNYPVPMTLLIERLESGTYDLKTPFQRNGDIWPTFYKEQLLMSIFSEITINAIHISLNPYTCVNFYIIDGKQRLESILSFKRGEIYLGIKKKDNSVLKLDYTTLMNSKDPDVIKYKIKFENYIMPVVEHVIEGDSPEDIINQQVEIFKKINYSRELSRDESILCPSFMTRNVLSFIHESDFGKLCSMGISSIKSNDRLEALGLLLQICYTSFDEDLMDLNGFSFKSTFRKNLFVAAENFHNYLWSRKITANTDISVKLLKELGIYEIYNRVNKASKWLYDILTFNNDIPKDLTTKQLFDCVIFLLKRIEMNILTDNFVYSDGNLEKMYYWAKEFFEKREIYVKEEGSNDSSARKDAIERRHCLAENIWCKYFKDEVKNKSIPAVAKRKAVMSSGKKCKYSGATLNKDNYVIDHEVPKSYAGKSNYFVISETSNLLKSGMNKQYAETYLKCLTEEEIAMIERDKKILLDKKIESIDLFSDSDN